MTHTHARTHTDNAPRCWSNCPRPDCQCYLPLPLGICVHVHVCLCALLWSQAELQALLDTPYDSLTSEPETYESIQISADPVESREAQEQMLRALSAVQQRQRRPQWGILPDTSPPERLYSQQGQHVDVFEALKTASLTRPTRTHAPQRRDQATQGSTAADPTQRVIQSPSAWVSALTAHEQGVHGDTGGLHAQEADDTHTNMTHQARAVTGGAERGEGNMEPVSLTLLITCTYMNHVLPRSAHTRAYRHTHAHRTTYGKCLCLCMSVL